VLIYAAAPPTWDEVNYDSLIDDLRAMGVAVEPAGEVSQPFFSVKGRVIRINGDIVQVFEYDNAEAVDDEASLVSPDGSRVGTTMVTWVATPHFYKKDMLIVIYVGGDNDVINALERVLGKQYAGGVEVPSVDTEKRALITDFQGHIDI
jgi:hypothetical protein